MSNLSILINCLFLNDCVLTTLAAFFIIYNYVLLVKKKNEENYFFLVEYSCLLIFLNMAMVIWVYTLYCIHILNLNLIEYCLLQCKALEIMKKNLVKLQTRLHLLCAWNTIITQGKKNSECVSYNTHKTNFFFSLNS